MRKLLLFLSVLFVVSCESDYEKQNQNFLEKYNNIVFNDNDDVEGVKIWFSGGRIRGYNMWETGCSNPINTEGSLSLSDDEFLFEYGSGTVNFTIVTHTADELVLQIQVSGDATCGTNSTWYNYWTFTVYGNSLTFEMVELTSCNPDDFATYTDNYSKTTEDIPDC